MIYETEAGSSDEQLIERLDFHGRARRCGSWAMAEIGPPIISGGWRQAPKQVAERVMTAAIEVGVIGVSTEWDRRVPLASYRGVGVVEVDGVHWYVRGDAAHDNQNHEFTAGLVRGHVVRPVEVDRLRSLSVRLLAQQDVQRAMNFAHFAGDSLESLDRELSDEATGAIQEKMVRLRVWSVDVESFTIDTNYAFLVNVLASCDVEVAADLSIPVHPADGRLVFEAVPRAGISELIGLHLDIPSPDGPRRLSP